VKEIVRKAVEIVPVVHVDQVAVAVVPHARVAGAIVQTEEESKVYLTIG